MLSIVASIFDPLGFLSPFTLTGKRILQTMCQGNIGWNDPLPAESLLEWETWIKDLQNLDLIEVPYQVPLEKLVLSCIISKMQVQMDMGSVATLGP